MTILIPILCARSRHELCNVGEEIILWCWEVKLTSWWKQSRHWNYQAQGLKMSHGNIRFRPYHNTICHELTKVFPLLVVSIFTFTHFTLTKGPVKDMHKAFPWANYPYLIVKIKLSLMFIHHKEENRCSRNVWRSLQTFSVRSFPE